jgi:histidinol-phosphate phosphatase family protein
VSSSTERAIFLDRDGVINRRRPDHVRSWGELEFLPGSLAALRRLHQRGERVVVVTNQSGVGRGLITRAELAAIHELMVEAIESSGGHIERIYVCPHLPSLGCSCRKPRVGMLLRGARELRIDLSRSILVGDSLTDVLAAQAAGCQPILVGDARTTDVDDDVPVVGDLCEAVSLLASQRLTRAGC